MRFFCGFLLAFFCQSGLALAWSGTVINVHDGDTVNIAPGGDEELPVAVRLYGLDAPELNQQDGQESAQWLRNMLPQGSAVEIIPFGVDGYGRSLGLIQVGGHTINAAMVQAGQAWVYGRYCKASFCRRWEKDQQQARNQKKGLWHEKATAPWEWRKAQKKAGG